MDLESRIKMLWLLLRERSPAGARRRRRLCAAGGVAIFVAGFLAAVGLGWIVASVLAAVALAFVVTVATVTAPRIWRATCTSYRSGWIGATGAAAGRASHALVQRSGPALTRARAGTTHAAQLSLPLMRDAGARLQRVHVPGQLEALAGEVRARTNRTRLTGSSLWQLERRAPLQREALRRNGAGVQLRRQGSYAQAATEHRAALEILRALGDQRAVALTLNNLALALSHDDGDDTTAVALFQEAATILGELGDDQDEGQVIANLGLTHLRHGRDDEANNVLQLALAKLAPASSAYHQVEAELRRAS
jgi:hypothetical protein